MFGLGSKKQARRDGAQTEGQVHGLTGYGTSGDFGVKVRVELPDGSPTEFRSADSDRLDG